MTAVGRPLLGQLRKVHPALPPPPRSSFVWLIGLLLVAIVWFIIPPLRVRAGGVGRRRTVGRKDCRALAASVVRRLYRCGLRVRRI